MTAISIRFNDKQYKQVKQLANFEGETITSFIRNAVLDKVEDIEDIELAKTAMKESDGNFVSADELKKELGIL